MDSTNKLQPYRGKVYNKVQRFKTKREAANWILTMHRLHDAVLQHVQVVSDHSYVDLTKT